MADAKDAKGTAPPYIAFSTLKTLLSNLKNDGVPSRIDRTMLRSFSGQVGSQLMTALKFLGLTDADGKTTPMLEAVVTDYGTPNWEGGLGNLLKDAYAPMFKLNLEKSTPGEFAEHFSNNFEGDGATQRKSMTFFVNALRESKLPVSAYLLKTSRPRTGPTKKRVPKEKRNDAANSNDNARNNTQDNAGDNTRTPHHQTKLPSETLLGMFDTKMDKTEQDALWLLIKHFKTKGQ